MQDGRTVPRNCVSRNVSAYMSVAANPTAATQGGRTVPRIFVHGQFIGGADDVTAKDASGELQALLKQKNLI